MPSRSRNRLDFKLVKLCRLFYYRFKIHLNDHFPNTCSPGGWSYTKLKNGLSVEEATDVYKRTKNYIDVNPWPVEEKFWNAHHEKLPLKIQKEKGLIL